MPSIGEETKRGCRCGRGPAIGVRSMRAWNFYCQDCGFDYSEPATPLDLRPEPVQRDNRVPPSTRTPRRS